MKIACPHCAVKGTLPDSLIHKNVRCPRCKQIFRAEAEVEFMAVEEMSPQVEQTAPPRQVTPHRPVGERPERVIVPPDAKLSAEPLGKIPETEAPIEIDTLLYSDEQSAPVTSPVPPQNKRQGTSAASPPAQRRPRARTAPPSRLTEDQARADRDTSFAGKSLCARCGRRVGDNENFSFGQGGLVCPACRAADGSTDTFVYSAEAKPVIDWDGTAEVSDRQRENELREIALGGGRRQASSDTGFAIFPILRETWEKLKGVKRNVWGAVVIIVLLNLILGAAIHFPLAAKIPTAFIGVIIVGVIAFFLNNLLLSGLGYLGLCQARGEEGGWNTMFVCFAPVKLVKLLILFVMQSIVIAFGFLCLVVPGIYFMVTLSCSPLLVLDKGMQPWAAMRDSWRACHANCLNIFLIYLVTGVAFCAVVGLFWMLPFVFVLYGVIYRRLFDGA